MAGQLGNVVRPLTRTFLPAKYPRSGYSTFHRKSPHAEWYSQILPSMFPIALLGSTVYIALHLVQTHLARERYVDQAQARIETLEHELESLRLSDPEPQSPRFRQWRFF